MVLKGGDEMTTKISKKISILVVLLLLGLAIVGCNPVNGAQPDKNEVKTEEKEVASEEKPKVIIDKAESKSHLTVTGESTKSIKPSIAYLNLGITTNAEDLKDAQKDNTTKMNALLKAIKDNGIADADIQTSSYNMYPQYDHETYSKIVGYNVQHIINVTVRDMEKAGAIMDIAVDNGANSSHSMTFGITDEEREEIYIEAMKDAIEKGQVKAQALADGMKIKIQGPVEVVEGSRGFTTLPSYDMNMKQAEESSTSFMPGELKVNATVTLIYEY